jgi:hypothetical protein
MPKVYRGSAINDMFVTEKIDCFNLPGFPQPQASTWVINYGWLFMALVNVYPSHNFSMPMGNQISLETSW